MVFFIVMSPAEHVHAQRVDDDTNYQAGGRNIDAANPGTCTNINVDATSYQVGETVPLEGMIVTPQRMVDDPDCVRYAPALREFLMTLPWCELDSDIIFAPVDE